MPNRRRRRSALTIAEAGIRQRIGSCSYVLKVAPSSTCPECEGWSFGRAKTTSKRTSTISKPWRAGVDFVGAEADEVTDFVVMYESFGYDAACAAHGQVGGDAGDVEKWSLPFWLGSGWSLVDSR